MRQIHMDTRYDFYKYNLGLPAVLRYQYALLGGAIHVLHLITSRGLKGYKKQQ